jgi:mono/diheme cytochrome c family protein
MPAWGKVWSDEQISDVAEYVYRQFLQPGPGEGH